MIIGGGPMDTLNFATYAKTIKEGMCKATNIEVTKLLLNFIVNDEEVLNKEGEQYNISNYYVHRWINEHTDIPVTIKKAASCPEIIAKSEDYFEKKVINALSPQKELDTYSTLLKLIEKDVTMSNHTKNNLINLYEDNEIGKFLSDTFLYSLQKGINKSTTCSFKEEDLDTLNEEDFDTLNEDDLYTLNEIYNKFPSPKRLIPPGHIEDHETTYTMELLAAYADKEGVLEISTEDLKKYPKYHKNFERQREYYYAAKSIRQLIMDIFCDEEFNMLKSETLAGIIDIYEDDYENGFKRLNEVMKHVTTIQLSQSKLTKIPGLISIIAKKGLCHILVNDKEITWVYKDE